MKRLIALLSIVLLSGCAAFGPNVDDPRLTREESAAREALEEAREHQAPSYQAQTYTAAEDRFESVQNQHRQNPSESIIGDYRLVQIQANRATIDSLVAQLREQKRKLSEKEQRISSLSREVHNQQENLESKDERIENLRATREMMSDSVSSYRDQLSQTRSRIDELEETVESRDQTLEERSQETKQFQQTIEQQEEEIRKLTRARERWQREEQRLTDRLKRTQEENKTLEEALLTVEDTAANLRQKLEARKQTVAALRRENDSIAKRVREELEDGDVRQEDDRVVINLQERILFDLGDARLKPAARETIQKIVAVLEQYENRPIRVEGHTDDLPIKDTIKDQYPSNWELSAQRAINVTKYMIHTLNVPSRRVAAVAYGQTRPLVPNDSTANRARNRRVEIVLLPEDLPTKPTDQLNNDTSASDNG